MKNIVSLAAAFFILTLVSCGGYKPSARQSKFGAEFKKELSAPLTIDSAFINNLDTLEALGGGLLEDLKKDSLNTDISGDIRSSVQGCILIDRLKQQGRYQNYLDSLDIGMLKNAMAFTIGKIKVGDRFLLLWGINESSYDACPLYSGTSIIASWPTNDGGFTHIVAAEMYDAADAPLALWRRTSSTLGSSEISVFSVTYTENAETEEGPKLKETKKMILKIDEGALKLESKNESK